MIDFRTMGNEEIVRNVRGKLYSIICEHAKHFDDENTMMHIERFLEGVSWATGLRYAISANGEVYIYLKCLSWAEIKLYTAGYKVIDIRSEIKTLRNSINRHYAKMGWSSAEEVCFDERH